MSKKGKSGSKGSKISGAGPQIWPRGGSSISSRGKGGNPVGDMTSACKQPKGKKIIGGRGK